MRETMRIIRALWAVAGNELDKLRWTLISIVLVTAVGIISILWFKPEVDNCILISFAIFIFSIYRLFSVRRFINLHLTGEALEILEALFSKEAGSTIASIDTGAFDNPFIRGYLGIISQIILVQTSVFLMLTLYINFTYGGAICAIIIIMLAAIILIDNTQFFVKTFRFAVKITIFIYSIALVFMLFPHVGLYLGKYVKTSMVDSSTAKKVNELHALQRKQQAEIHNKFLGGVIEWQKKHPGEELPPEYQAKLEEYRQLKVGI